mmetsp:Transcript_30148/g.45972  ORF Transcript_30148/g.45972 Transcript_30148/m.45972 type:complete len:190 (+) Transcript_30148:8-577(+)
MRSRSLLPLPCFLVAVSRSSYGLVTTTINCMQQKINNKRRVGGHNSRLSSPLPFLLRLLSDKYLENDLVAIQITNHDDNPRLCVVTSDGGAYPLCIHEDDVETDLFIDPRITLENDDVIDEHVVGSYGEGWYSQRPVPSLGGGPGYGAEADSVWSIEEDLLEAVANDNVDLPVLDIGISHGEKARGGAF